MRQALRTAAINELKSISITGLNLYALANEETIALLYREGIIDNASIDNALEQAVFSQAREDYRLMTKQGTYADHVGSPESLAYAMKGDRFSPKETGRFNFDHGDTPETFIEQYYREDFLPSLRVKLLHPEPLPSLAGADTNCLDFH